jgi:hypothetical protein
MKIRGLVLLIAGIVLVVIVAVVSFRAVRSTQKPLTEKSLNLARTSEVVYHVIDANGLQTFSPTPGVACFWIDVRRDESSAVYETNGAPKIPTRSSGLSCLELTDEAWGTYEDRWPIRKTR